MSPASAICSLNCSAQRARHSSLASSRLRLLDRRAAQIVTRQLEQVEREQHRLGLRLAAVSQPIEQRNAILAADEQPHRRLGMTGRGAQPPLQRSRGSAWSNRSRGE
jgi:hypothetical protein